MKRLYGLLGLIFLLSGCVQQKQDNNEPQGMVCNAAHVKRSDLIKPHSQKNTPSKNKYDSVPALQNTIVTNSLDSALQYEAQSTDVPIPVMSKPIKVSRDGAEGVQLVYHCSLLIEEVKDFYKQEMERQGWQQRAQFEGEEYLYYFSKPARFCIVSLRPYKRTWDYTKKIILSLFTGKA